MSKLSFRARALDAAKPMPIYKAEELPDLPDYSAINRAVPQMPSGMEKEEECEHHLQRAICTGLIIPTPEVSNIEDTEAYDRLYGHTYKMPRQLIHMQPFAMEHDIPDYDMDSEDERFVNAQAKKMDLTPLKFEEMMDRLEKGSGQTVVQLHEAKGLLKEDDDLIIAVYDYWLNKRLKAVSMLGVPLTPVVKTEHRVGTAANTPYLAFRRRTEKMQTRKNRKNDETSYEKMLKLRRDLSRTVTLLELVKRREKTKREHLHLTIEIFEKRYQAQDFSGQLLAELSAIKAPRPAFAPIFSNQFGLNQQHWLSKVPIKEEVLLPRKEKRQYKRRKHKGSIGGVISRGSYLMSSLQGSQDALASSEEELESTRPEFQELSQCDSEGMFSFRRKFGCNYLPPTSGFGNWPWCGKDENGGGDKRFRYCPTNIATPRVKHIGLARKRVGRGGRIILDRASGFSDDFWSSCDFTVYDNKADLPLYQPKTPPEPCESQWTNSDSENAIDSLPNTLIIDVENLDGCGNFNSFHTSDDEQSGDNSNSSRRRSTGGKRGSAEETSVLKDVEDSEQLDVTNKSDELTSPGSELDSVNKVFINNSDNGSPIENRTRTVGKINGEGCVSNRFRNGRNCVRFDDDVVGQRNHFYDRRRTDNFSFNSISDLNRPGKRFFRRNYRIGGFKNINYRRKRKEKEEEEEEKEIFTTSEISLPELFADSSVSLIPEPELETNDDSFAILDKLGLDDDFIKKEPEISLDGDKSDGFIKTETGQNFTDSQSNPFQKQRLKIDAKNIFELSESDFLKYETDCDVDDLLPDIVQNDVVGCCGLFGLTPNSRFNLQPPSYLPLESEKAEGEENPEEKSSTQSDGKLGQSSSYGQIADISSDIENHEVTLQLKINQNMENNAPSNILTSRLNSNNEEQQTQPAQSQTQSHQQQTMNDIYALNHHNYTISGPPSYNFKQTQSENKLEVNEVTNNVSSLGSSSSPQTNAVCSNYNQGIANIISSQVVRTNQQQQTVKTNRTQVMPTTTTTGFTKLSALSGARITQNLGHTTINHDPTGSGMLRDQSKVVNNAGIGDSISRNLKEEVVKTSNHDGPGILRTYRGNNARNMHLSSDGNLVVQDTNKKSVSNGPATLGYNQRRIVRAGTGVAAQQQATSISAQNPTVTQLISSPSVFTIEGMTTNQNFVGSNQNFVVSQSFVTSNQNANFLGGNQTVNYVATNQNVLTGNQLKSLPQRKVSLLVNPAQAVAASETVDVELGNESLETVDIETSEADESEEQQSSQEITVDNQKQMNVRKNNSLPMEVT